MGSMKVLIVEDDPVMTETLAVCFYVGWLEASVICVGTGEEAIAQITEQPPSIVVLDLGLPGMDGYQALEKIRALSEVPVILLTAKEGEMARIKGLELGADDYINKPFSHIVLMARVKAVLRRGPVDFLEESRGVYQNVEAGLEINLDSRAVSRHGRPVDLAPLEYKLLELFVRNEGRVLPHQKILSDVWGREYSEETAYLKVYIRRVRNKLFDSREPELIHSQRGVGYVYRFQPRGINPTQEELILQGAGV